MSHYRHLLKRAAISACFIAIAFFVAWADPVRGTQVGATDVWFFDIGQGDAFLIQSGSTQIIIDGGPTGKLVEKLGRVMPFWDQTIEYVFVSHPHADHFVGLLPLTKYYVVEQVYVPPQEDGGSDWETLLAWHDEEILAANDQMELAPGIMTEILWPIDSTEKQYDDPNAGSLIMLLDIHGTRILFTGDAGIEEEESILHEIGDIDILKVGHHGSYTSTSRELLEVTMPEHGVISAGQENSYGHPHEVILNRLKEFNTNIWRTDQDGDIRVRIDTNGYEMSQFWL